VVVLPYQVYGADFAKMMVMEAYTKNGKVRREMRTVYQPRLPSSFFLFFLSFLLLVLVFF
jgi:hypothetical protein